MNDKDHLVGQLTRYYLLNRTRKCSCDRCPLLDILQEYSIHPRFSINMDGNTKFVNFQQPPRYSIFCHRVIQYFGITLSKLQTLWTLPVCCLIFFCLPKWLGLEEGWLHHSYLSFVSVFRFESVFVFVSVVVLIFVFVFKFKFVHRPKSETL